MEKLDIEHLSGDVKVYGGMFREVENASFLQTQLTSRNPDFEYAFIDGSTVVSRRHLLAAIFTAISGELKTANIHSEIVYSLSPASNVSPTSLAASSASSAASISLL